MWKCNIWPILNAKMDIKSTTLYKAPIRMSKWDFECKKAIFGPNYNIKRGF